MQKQNSENTGPTGNNKSGIKAVISRSTVMVTAAVDSISIRHLGAVLGVLIVLLGILDVISTNMVIAAGGTEMNPIVSWTMEQLENWWQMPKLAIHIVAGLLVFYWLNSRFTATLAFMLVFMYGVVVHHNFSLLMSV